MNLNFFMFVVAKLLITAKKKPSCMSVDKKCKRDEDFYLVFLVWFLPNGAKLLTFN